jgi:hypothetical membrane protein
MKNRSNLSFAASLLVVPGYILFTAIAACHYPLPYAPIHNWLSDLGNPVTNPGGAFFYNLGLSITAGLILAFFLGLSRLKMENKRIQNVMTNLTMVFGAAGSFGILMSAIHPINQPNTHSLWCMVLYICLGTAFAFSVAALRYDIRYPKWLLILGVLTALFDMLASLFFPSMPIFE